MDAASERCLQHLLLKLVQHRRLGALGWQVVVLLLLGLLPHALRRLVLLDLARDPVHVGIQTFLGRCAAQTRYLRVHVIDILTDGIGSVYLGHNLLTVLLGAGIVPSI